MKTSKTSATGIICVVSSLMCLMTANADLHKSQASVKQLKGAAHYSVNQGAWLPLKLNTTLRAGTLIKTAPESTVTILFKDSGNTLVANPNTILRLTKLLSGETGLEPVSETSLELVEGSVVGSHKKTSALSVLIIDGVKVPSGYAYKKESAGSLTLTLSENNPQLALAETPQVVFAADRPQEKPSSPNGNNGVGNGEDPAPPGNPKENDGAGTGPGNPGNGRPNRP